jgi:putative transposon-encoded protein
MEDEIVNGLVSKLTELKIIEILRRPIKKIGTSAHIFIPKKLIGKNAIIIITE